MSVKIVLEEQGPTQTYSTYVQSPFVATVNKEVSIDLLRLLVEVSLFY